MSDTAPQPISQVDIDAAKLLLADPKKGPEAAYAYLSNRGYTYATLASGVATGNTLSGLAALEFMESTVEAAGGTLTQAQVDDIRRRMAAAYLGTLESLVQASPTGTINRDITGEMAWKFHQDVFEDVEKVFKVGLSQESWTMDLVFKALGDTAHREALWDTMLERAGTLKGDLEVADLVSLLMLEKAQQGDADAWEWLKRVWSDPDQFAAFLHRMAMELKDADLSSLPEWMQQAFDGDAKLLQLFSRFLDGLDGEVNQETNDLFLQARNYRWRPDPLALDLDGDGIETIADNGSVLFDFDGDGVRNGTGWVGRDDGLLVLDRNGNGSIDNGGELFGADTVLANGQRATSGFQALRDLDSNSDGQFNADDAQFGAVRVWRDLNQDGASQATELFTLDQLDIAAINLTPTSVTDVNLGGGNAIDNSGVYTRTDGSQGGAYDLLLQRNMFFRDFSNSPLPVPITDEAAALPNVQGSGAVRDLVEAASLFARTWHATFLRTFHAMPRPENSFV